MSATIIDGKAVAARVRATVGEQAAAFAAAHGRPPGLATFLVGDDAASAVYIGAKQRACLEVGIASLHRDLPASTTQQQLLDAIGHAVHDDAVDGILVQFPLPSHIDERVVLQAIAPAKDVDGFHPCNVGALALGLPGLPQCTPAGVVRLLDAYDIPIAGANVAIAGRSNLVGKPLAQMLLARDATVTLAHSRTRDLAAITRSADIVVMAVGRAHLLTADMVAPGAAVIDVGITRTDEGLVGDVDFEAVAQVASHITPVPGGVGPMTIALLLENTVRAAQQRADAS